MLINAGFLNDRIVGDSRFFFLFPNMEYIPSLPAQQYFYSREGCYAPAAHVKHRPKRIVDPIPRHWGELAKNKLVMPQLFAAGYLTMPLSQGTAQDSCQKQFVIEMSIFLLILVPHFAIPMCQKVCCKSSKV